MPDTAAAPLISVIVPVYNVEDHVGACLRSLQRQTLADFEVLVVDDGSTDSSAARIRDTIAGDARFQLLSQSNQGLSAARNAGLDRARGAFIAFVDSDDRVMPHFLHRLHSTIEETEADWVACAVRFSLPDGSGQVHTAIHGDTDLGQHRVRRRCPFNSWLDVVRHFPSAWNKLYRRQLIDGLRFEAGTWFEDHGFFQRAAARTDHIVHLPEALYLQTQGRDRQITGADDDRVFDLFGVLAQMRTTLGQAHPDGAEAFVRIATRLIYERSTVLRTPARRARFAKACADFLTAEGIAYAPDAAVDPEITHSFALEMAGVLPLSVVIPWHGRHPHLLTASLAAVAESRGPAHEVLVVCDTSAAEAAARACAAPYPAVRVIRQRGRGAGGARNAGLAQATGRFITFLDAGDCPHPWAYLRWVDALMANEADMAISQFRAGGHVRTGVLDLGPWPTGLPATGPIHPTPRQALTLEPHLSAKMFDRDFLLHHKLRFGGGDRPDWAFCLAVALQAPVLAYVGWAGVAVGTSAEAQEVHQAPFSMRRLLGGHFAVLRSLRRLVPPARLSQMPNNWQRRLYARALPADWPFETEGRGVEQVTLAGAVLEAACYRFAGARAPQPGRDPTGGPKQAILLDPRLALHALWARLRGRPDLGAVPAYAANFEHGHQAFDLRERGVFRFRTDFQTHDYANLSFHAPNARHMPLHLSVRQREGLIVLNDTRSDGAWRAERRVACTLPKTGTDIAVHLAPGGVEVFADGVLIHRARPRRLWHRAGVRDIPQIETFTLLGGVRPTEVLPQTPKGQALILDPRLQVRSGRTAPGASLSVAAKGHSAPRTVLHMLPCADGMGQVAFLPGRIWTGLPEGAVLELSLVDETGAPQERLSLSRADMAARITDVLDTRVGPEDAALVLLIAEHVRFGGLMPLLPQRAQARALDLAARFGQADALVDPSATEAPAAVEDAHRTQFHTALAEFSRAQTLSPAPDPLQVLADLAVDPEPRVGLFLTLSEFFCAQGQDTEGYVALAHRLHTPLPTPETGLPDPTRDPWTCSALLPFLICGGHAERAGDLILEMAEPQDGWVLTRPLAWAVHRALQPQDMPDAARRKIIAGFMRFVSLRATEYWERAPCTALIGAAVALLQHGSAVPYQRSEKIARFCLQAYGLARPFWEALSEQNVTLPAPLDAAREQFERLQESKGRDAAALAFFTRHKVAGADRFCREAGVAQDGLTDMSDSAAHIRAHAAPGAPVTTSTAETANAVADLYADVQRAPYFDTQIAAARQVHQLWQSPDRAQRGLDDNLALLGQAGSHFLGLALGMTRAAVSQSNHDFNWLTDRISAMSETVRAHASATTAVRMAMLGLREQSPEWADSIETLLPSERSLPVLRTDGYAGLPQPSPFLDTLVVVFSCQAYLDTRIPALRKSWLGQLEALGVPYIVVVGNGDGQRDGDVVALDAPDDYEGLPQKTLAAIAWVRDETRFAYMLKIDDDCFLNAPLFFEALSYRKFDYYGRGLTRGPGQMDRAWHQGKSRSDRGRFEFDKSIEPSSYADGGSGYTLSRDAMDAALDAAASPEGQQLIQVSFMEDKMLGDLLALRGIVVNEEDYRVTIRRRTHRDAIPVASWHNSFLPSQDVPVQIAHLDTHLDMADAQARLQAPGLWPRKIWPTYQEARLGYQTNALELISDERSVDIARQAEVAVVACMRNEMFMLPHFLAHYRALGVGSFLIADNCSDDGTLEYLAAQPDVALFSVDTDYNKSRYGVAWQQAMLAAFRMDKWSLVADADELLVWERPQVTTLPELLKTPEFAQAEAARIFMLDMYPKGPLSDASFASGDPFAEAGFADAVPFLTDSPMRGPYSDQPAWTSALRHRLIPGSTPNLFVAQKIALLRYRPWMRLSAGLHFVADVRLAERELIFAHFKYNAAFREKARAEVARGQHFNNAEEYQKYLALAAEGRDTIYDPGLSVPWFSSPFVQDRLGGG